MARTRLHRALRFADSIISETFLYPRSLEDYVGYLDPTFSVRETKAVVRDVRRETRDAVTLRLEPNARFMGWRAGQYVALTVELNGRRTTRCFSISSAPESGLLELTIKARSGGHVSVWANERVRAGDVVVLGDAQGEFVLPSRLPETIVFVAAGSGVTPIASVVESALARNPAQRVEGLLYARSTSEVLFGDRLASLSRTFSYVRVRVVLTDARAGEIPLAGHFEAAHLDALGVELDRSLVYACGPAPLLDAVRTGLAARGHEQRLRVERFNTPEPAPRDDEERTYDVRFPGGRSIAASTRRTLLVQAEEAGLSPTHGCRRGLCHACVCTLVEGTVENVVTGSVRSEPGAPVQLCVDVPRSNLTLAV